MDDAAKTHDADVIASEVEVNGVASRTIEELADESYHARAEWSVSQLKLLPDEPEMFWGRHIAKLPDHQKTPSPSMRLGTVVHEALLQGIEPRIIPRDVLSKSGSRAGSEWKAFIANHPGEVWLKQCEAEPILRCLDSVRANKKAVALLELPGDPELAVFWRDESTGLPLRGRLDKLIRVGNGMVLDLKTAADPTERGFPFACLDLKYHVQAAAYMEAAEAALDTKPEAFMFVAVQVAAPYVCQVYVCDKEMLELGFIRLREALSDLDTRLKTNDWHRDGHNAVNTLNLPPKAYQSY